ncbi:MAG: hypothetical protein NZ898_10000 [Myxococcota bacterium]|nr:hypothetical protein [Myxococcota bacterium]MDW8362233.1 hypothetical protein [Myxococcales bacterium]
MRNALALAIASSLLAGLLAAALADPTDAQRRRRNRGRQPQAARVETPPTSAQIAPALGELRWGMSKEQVFEHFSKQIRDRYQERLSKARDAMTEDAIRAEMNNEIRRIRDSYVRFDGRTTGWDVSFLRAEYTHNNNESMMVVRDGNSQNFYFFINNRLWKWYKAFDASVFEGQPFEQFARALQNRFGPGLERSQERDGRQVRWLEWQDESTRLRAIDENHFYGFYCLVFEEKATLANLDNLRVNRPPPRESGNAFVRAVVESNEEVSTANQDIVDRITGMIRRREDAPDPTMTGMGTAPTAMSSTGASSATQMTRVDDDPLRGVDL